MIAYHSLWDSAFIFLCPGVDLAFLVAPLPRCLLCPILVVLAVVVSTSSSRRRLDIVISSSSRHRHLVVVVAAVVISSARECTGPCVSAQDHAGVHRGAGRAKSVRRAVGTAGGVRRSLPCGPCRPCPHPCVHCRPSLYLGLVGEGTSRILRCLCRTSRRGRVVRYRRVVKVKRKQSGGIHSELREHRR